MEHASKCDYIDFSKKGLLLLVKIKKTNIQQKSDLKSTASTPALLTLKNNLDKSYIQLSTIMKLSTSLTLRQILQKILQNCSTSMEKETSRKDKQVASVPKHARSKYIVNILQDLQKFKI